MEVKRLATTALATRTACLTVMMTWFQTAKKQNQQYNNSLCSSICIFKILKGHFKFQDKLRLVIFLEESKTPKILFNKAARAYKLPYFIFSEPTVQ